MKAPFILALPVAIAIVAGVSVFGEEQTVRQGNTEAELKERRETTERAYYRWLTMTPTRTPIPARGDR